MLVFSLQVRPDITGVNILGGEEQNTSLLGLEIRVNHRIDSSVSSVLLIRMFQSDEEARVCTGQ